MVGEDDPYFGKGDLFFLLCNHFLDWAAMRVPSYSVEGRGTSSWEILYLYYEEMV